MAKQINIGVGGVVKKVSKVPASIGGVVKEMKKGVCGVGGVVKEFWTALDTDLTILEAHQAGYWTRAATFGNWTYDKDPEEDGGDSYFCQFIDMMNSNMSQYGTGYVGDGGSYGGMDNHFLAYQTYRDTTKYNPTKFAFAFFCPTKDHADALAECIKNRYTKLSSGIELWNTNENTISNAQSTRNITSVTSLGLCSDIAYKMYYTSGPTGYYNFANDSYYSPKYVVEVVIDNYLNFDRDTDGSWKFSFYVKFS